MSDLLFLVPLVVAGALYTMMRLMLVIAPQSTQRVFSRADGSEEGWWL